MPGLFSAVVQRLVAESEPSGPRGRVQLSLVMVLGHRPVYVMASAPMAWRDTTD